MAARSRSRGGGALTQEPCETEQRICVNWLEPPPPPPSSAYSWGTSSVVSDATPDNLASGSEELAGQQAKMTEATTKLLAVVSEVGGAPWDASPGLTEGLLTVWLGEQEDRGDNLREKVDRKQEELTRLAEGAEANFLGPVGADRVASQAPPHLDPSSRFNHGQYSREQASRDQDQRTPGQGRREDGNQLPSPIEAPLLASHTGSGERGGRDQPQPAFLRRFPMLKRGRTKLEAERSGLDDVVEEAVQGGMQQKEGGAD